MSDNSADSFDFASEIETAFRESAIAEARKILAPPRHFDGKNCSECDEPIPILRLALAKHTCVYCQEEIERKKFLNR